MKRKTKKPNFAHADKEEEFDKIRGVLSKTAQRAVTDRKEVERKVKSSLLVLLSVISLIVILFFPFGNYLEKEGNLYTNNLSSLRSNEVEGRETRSLDLGFMSPNKGVSVLVLSIQMIVRVQVLESNDLVPYDETRNGTFYTKIYPSRMSSLTLRITKLSKGDYTDLDKVMYTSYSRFPYFEIVISMVFVLVTTLFVGLTWYFREGIHEKGFRILLVNIPVAAMFACFTWYLYAFASNAYLSFLAATLASVSAAIVTRIQSVRKS